MKLSMIWAMSKNRTIGRDNDLPWHLPEDLKHFKRTTMGKPVIMGRKTWDSIGKPLPGRSNIVITRNEDFAAEGVSVVHTFEAAISLQECVETDEVVVIGGVAIYALAFPLADRLYLTRVHAQVKGDTFFPEFDENDWQEIHREDFKACENNPYDYSFTVLERR